MNQKIIPVKSDLLNNIIPLVIYVIWNKNTNRFCGGTNHTFMRGVYSSEENAYKDITTEEDCIIITIDLSSKIPADLKRIADFKGDWSNSEKEGLIQMKFRQMIKTFVFNNSNMIENLKKQYSTKQLT